MSESFGRLVVIAEAAVASRLPAVEAALTAMELSYRTAMAAGPGDATRLAREALSSGGRFLVAVGGDGLVHDVVNGMFSDGASIGAEPPVLGVVAAGTDNDFVRTFALPADVDRACAHLAGHGVFPIDVGSVAFATENGEATRYFCNIAEAGLGAEVVARSNRLPGRLGRGRQFLGFWTGLARFKPAAVHVEAARKTHDGTALNVVVGNGRFAAGGSRVSPRSFPGDGVFDVLVMSGPKSDVFTKLPKVFQGEQVPDPNITELRGNRIRIEADRPLLLALDGRVVGTTPATFRVIPRAVLLKV